MGTFTDGVTMECTPEGEPLRMRWAGVWLDVVAPPLNWYQRRPWWQEQTSLRPGEGVGYVDVQVWRLQVVPEGGTELRTVDVALYRPSLQWRVMKVHARVDEPAAGGQEAVSYEAGSRGVAGWAGA